MTGNQSQSMTLHLLGPFAVEIGDRTIAISSRKGRALLALLAVSGRPVATRESLLGRLWSDRSRRDAQNNLRQCLHALQKNLSGFNGFKVGRDTVELVPNAYRTDLQAYLDVLADPDTELPARRPDSVLDQILTDLHGLDPAFDTWLAEYRGKLRAQIVAHLSHRMDKAGADAARLDAARALFQADPVNEPACRTLIRAALAHGDVPAALTHYQALWTRMDAEFGDEPSSETQALIITFRQQPASAPPPAQATDPRPHIVLEGLDITGLDPDLHRLAGGFRIDLLASLIRFREWLIFDADDHPAGPLAGQGYRLSTAMLGTLDDLHLIATLKSLRDGGYLWSERIELPSTSWLNMQQQIIRRLSVALNLHFAWDRADLIDEDDTASLETYDRWLLANRLFLDYDLAKWDRARQIFQDIARRTPRFARAYSSLAGLDNARQLAFPGQLAEPEQFRRALGLSRQAVALDPIDNRTQLALGWSCAMSGHHEQSALAFGLAHRHNENDPWTMISSAVGLAFCDQTASARQMNARAIEINPRLTPFNWSYIAASRFLDGDFEGCVTASERAEEITPDVPAWHMAALAQLGRRREASQVCDRFVQITSAAWQGKPPATVPAIGRWITTCFPIRNPAARAAFNHGLAASGLALSQDT